MSTFRLIEEWHAALADAFSSAAVPGEMRRVVRAGNEMAKAMALSGQMNVMEEFTLVSNLQDHLAALRAQPQGWQPIETAPKDGTHILAWFHDDHPLRAYMAPYQSGISMAAWTSVNGGGWMSNRHGEPTHWMPLPEPPEEP